MKLTPHQERLCRLRCEHLLSDSEIARMFGKKPQTIRLAFSEIRQRLQVQSFEDAWKKYKNEHPGINMLSKEPHLQLQQNQPLEP